MALESATGLLISEPLTPFDPEDSRGVATTSPNRRSKPDEAEKSGLLALMSEITP